MFCVMQLQASEVICSFPTAFMIKALAEWFNSQADYLLLLMSFSNLKNDINIVF